MCDVRTKTVVAAPLRFLRGESGQDMLEYALLLAFLGLAAVAVLRGVGTHVVVSLSAMANALNSSI